MNLLDLKHLEHGLSTEEMDYRSYVLLTPKWRELELSCRNTCWFDYRFIHPFDATLLYIAAFHRVYRSVYASTFDRKSAKQIRIVEPADMIHRLDKNRSAIIGCWHGRQVADAMGIPYDAYISDAYTIRLKHWKQRLRHISGIRSTISPE